MDTFVGTPLTNRLIPDTVGIDLLPGGKEKNVSLFGAGILGGVIVCGLLTFPGFTPPNVDQWAKLAGYGLLAAVANVLTMWAARQAPAAYIGPTQYSQMIWAILLGYVLFGDGVDLPMVVGIVLIVASGLLTLIRENVRGTPLPPSVAGERHVAAALVPEAGRGNYVGQVGDS